MMFEFPQSTKISWQKIRNIRKTTELWKPNKYDSNAADFTKTDMESDLKTLANWITKFCTLSLTASCDHFQCQPA